MKTCKDCKFWVEEEAQVPQVNNGVLRGICHFNPPIATATFIPSQNMAGQVVPQRLDATTWPLTLADSWCGKFEARKTERQKVLDERKYEWGKDENENEQA